jgi:hypothetical protein
MIIYIKTYKKMCWYIYYILIFNINNKNSPPGILLLSLSQSFSLSLCSAHVFFLTLHVLSSQKHPTQKQYIFIQKSEQ